MSKRRKAAMAAMDKIKSEKSDVEISEDSFDEDDDDPDKIEVPGGGKTLEAAVQLKVEPTSKPGDSSNIKPQQNMSSGVRQLNSYSRVPNIIRTKINPAVPTTSNSSYSINDLKAHNNNAQNTNFLFNSMFNQGSNQSSPINFFGGQSDEFINKFLGDPGFLTSFYKQLLGGAGIDPGVTSYMQNPTPSPFANYNTNRPVTTLPANNFHLMGQMGQGLMGQGQGGLVGRNWSGNFMDPRQHVPEDIEDDNHEEENMGVVETYAEYKPCKLKYGKSHPDSVVETASLASVLPPDITYHLKLPKGIIDSKSLSALQLEAIVYASQKHNDFLPNGQKAGYLIGDGAGVGKGRTIAGIIYENYLHGRKKALWISVSADLKYDAERDLKDIDAHRIKVYPLNKMKYGKINASINGWINEGVIYSTYSSLIGSSSAGGKFSTRLKMLVNWCEPDFEGVIVFDECHKAKNLVPPSGIKVGTKTGKAVQELQDLLPKARVVYASATGASEPRNMAYMTRLGIWGKNTIFREFTDFNAAVEKRGVTAMELVAMHLKGQGNYLARQLSFEGVTFKIEQIPIDNDFIEMYNESVSLWVDALLRFTEALHLMGAEKRLKKVCWSQFWSSHQRFFKYLCIAAKVPFAVKLARESVKNGKCVVIGLQSTGEARTLEQLEKDEELESFVSTAKGVLVALVEKHFPCPSDKRANELKGLKASSMFTELLKECQPSSSTSAAEKRKPVRKAAQKAKKRVKFNRRRSDSDDENDSDSEFDYNNESSSDEESEGSASEDIDFISDSDSDDTSKKKKGRGGNGNLKKNGNGVVEDLIVVSREAKEQCVKMRDTLMEKIEKLGHKLPANTLDQLIDDLGGPQEVAEMTGRKGRVISNEGGQILYESRSESEISLEAINMEEKKRFMDGSKKIAIISEAASSGISLQSDRRVKNQLRRVHITLELPWSADRAIQQFGRTHRSNQVNAPEYLFLISDLAGEQRFASIVAKRLESLGALTHGDRRATESRDLSQFNIDTKYGRQALESIMKSILGYETPMVKPQGNDQQKFFQECAHALIGVGLFVNDNGVIQLDKEHNNMSKFLNRILGTPVKLQNSLFQFFTDTLSEIVLRAKKTGRYDLGILDIGDSESGEILVKKVREFNKKHSTGSSNITIHTLYAERGMCWSEALSRAELLPGIDEGFYLSKIVKNNKKTPIVAIEEASKESMGSEKRSKSKRIFSIYRPNTGLQIKRENLADLLSKNEKCTSEEAQSHWESMYDTMKDSCIHAFWNGKCRNRAIGLECEQGVRRRTYHVLSGAVLTVWTDVENILASVTHQGKARMQFVRVKLPEDKGKIVGVLIPNIVYDKLITFFENMKPDPVEINNFMGEEDDDEMGDD